MRDAKLIIGCVAIFAMIAIGGIYVYTFNADTAYSCTSDSNSGDLSYSVHSSISNCYDVAVLNNHTFAPATEYYLYYDSNYRNNIQDVFQPIGSTKLDFEYYTSQLEHQLNNRGIKVVKVNADELKEKLQSDISAGTCRKGLIDVAGTFPSTVYTGHSDDIVVKWISNGGSLYWVGGLIGSTYATQDSLVNVADYQSLFFSTECLNTGSADKAYSDDTNGFKDILSLSSNSVKYGVDVSSISDSLSMGYTEDGYSSIALVKKGSGMLCIVAGDYSNNQRADLAQVIASHVCYTSEIECHKSGTVTRGTVSQGTGLNLTTGYHSVYMYLGGYFLEYARCDLYNGSSKI